jgi:hypothetical protein
MNKVCARCGEEKPLSEYHKSGLDAYGNSTLKSKCRECVSIEAKYYRENNKEALKQKTPRAARKGRYRCGRLDARSGTNGKPGIPDFKPCVLGCGSSQAGA